MDENKSADWNWSDYFDHVVDPPMRQTVSKALEVLGEGEGRQAIDLGCGSGNDTVHMLNAGFKVRAIDNALDGLNRLKQRPHIDLSRLETQLASFKKSDLCPNIWTNAGFALPFCPQDVFEDIWQRLLEHIEPNGIFSGQLFGVKDSWNGKVQDMNFHDMAAIENRLQNLDVVMLNEEKNEGKDALGRPKYWHIFHIVIRV